MCAANRIGDDGAASLAPSLGRMTQLTSLYLGGTLRASAGLVLFAGACERRLCMDGVCCGWGGCARGCSRWWGLRGASRGAVVRAGNEFGADGAASLAPSLGRMTQLTSLHLSGTLRASAAAGAVSGCLQNAGCAWMVCNAGLGGCARGCSGWWGLRGASRGAVVRADNSIGDDAAASLRSSVPATCAVYL